MILLSLFVLICTVQFQIVTAQLKPILVTEQTIKVAGTKSEELHFAFSEGDELVFDFEEIEGKELKEIEIKEYEGSSKFADFKTKKIQDKRILVEQTAIYEFRFKNAAISGRICKFKIQRIPASEKTINFKSSIKNNIKTDTTWINIPTEKTIFDTTYVTKNKQELIKIDTVSSVIFDENIRVHSSTYDLLSSGEEVSFREFTLPQNSQKPLESKETLCWSYWLGVGKEASEQYKNVTRPAMVGLISKAGTILTTAHPLVSLALTGVSVLLPNSATDNVKYQFIGEGLYKTGDVTASFQRFETPTQGKIKLRLENDNIRDGIDVQLTVVAVQLVKKYKELSFQEQVVTQKSITVTERKPIVKRSKYPVMLN